MNNIEINGKIELQHEYFANNRPSVETRIKALKLLYKNIKLMTPKICEALKLDLNKSDTEAYMSEIGIVLDEISYMLKHIKQYAHIQPESTPLSNFPAKSYTMPCAYGVVLIISPWNYPFMLAIEPLVDAISAGNTAIIKPSEFSPNTSAVIQELISKTFSKEYVDVVIGGVEECTYLLDQDFDYIFFTGSTRVGKIVMQKAAEHFTPVTLEMGGKSPCIVDDSADIKLTAKRIVFGKFLNAGQTCVAPDYLYCSEKIKDKLLYELGRQIVLQYSVDALGNENYPRIINEKQYNRLVNLLDKNSILFGGKFNDKTLKIEPTILDANFDSEIMQNEIFGPLLPILTFKTIDEAIKNVNKHNKPLALYIFSNDKQTQEKVLNNCDFGGGCINDTIMHIANHNLPFGGIKQSGIGSYHGKHGFDTFTHYKSVVHKYNWLDLPMRYQPFTKLKEKLIKMFLK